jgi:hypothetical protein
MATYHLRPLTKCEPARRVAARRNRSVQRVPRPDDQLMLDLPLPAGRLRPAPRVRPVPETLDRRQVGRRVTTILEACDGRRPAVQVRPILEPSLYGSLLGKGRRTGGSYVTRSVHLCHPAEGAVEACATVEHGVRFVALAARFQRTSSGWCCTRFHLLEPGTGTRRLAA